MPATSSEGLSLPEGQVTSDFDYIIVGAGAAGCVLAHRLSCDPTKRILLLEAGPVDRHPLIHMPKGVGKMMAQARYVWPFHAEERHGSKVKTKIWHRGKTLGGSSAINGMMYVRGQPADFADLAAQTSDDWNWEQMKRCYVELEDQELVETAWRGKHGPLRITMPTDHDILSNAAIQAGKQMGLSIREDINEPGDVDRIGYAPRTLFNGKRQSSATAFLRPVRHRENLTVLTGVMADRVLFDGACANGVEAQIGSERRRFHGDKIVLSGGTLSSPSILERSGVGRADRLRSLGIPIVADRPEVGENLQEHWCLNTQWRIKKGASQNPEYRGWRLIKNVGRYYMGLGGPMANGTFDIGAWVRTKTTLDRTNVQFLINPITIDYLSGTIETEKEDGMTVAVYPTRPRAKGAVHIVSARSEDLPAIQLDFFASEEDKEEMVGAVRAARELCRQPALAKFIDHEVRPGAGCQSAMEILDQYRQHGSIGYHAVGTCRMGNDANSVVDPSTRVRETENLHVIDISVFPFVPAGNTFGPACALGWRAAELLVS